jgi:hypothetical protein
LKGFLTAPNPVPILKTIANLFTANGRAYLVLFHARLFAIGRIGAAAQISWTERALLRILKAPNAAQFFLKLLPDASLPGQLYALLGLRLCQYQSIEELMAKYRGRTDEVATQSQCFRIAVPVCDIVRQIENGNYAALLGAHDAS